MCPVAIPSGRTHGSGLAIGENGPWFLTSSPTEIEKRAARFSRPDRPEPRSARSTWARRKPSSPSGRPYSGPLLGSAIAQPSGDPNWSSRAPARTGPALRSLASLRSGLRLRRSERAGLLLCVCALGAGFTLQRPRGRGRLHLSFFLQRRLLQCCRPAGPFFRCRGGSILALVQALRGCGGQLRPPGPRQAVITNKSLI